MNLTLTVKNKKTQYTLKFDEKKLNIIQFDLTKKPKQKIKSTTITDINDLKSFTTFSTEIGTIVSSLISRKVVTNNGKK